MPAPATLLRLADPGAVVVHTDDVAWWHAAFDWVDLLVEGVLAPARRGAAVAYRPPKWDERGLIRERPPDAEHA